MTNPAEKNIVKLSTANIKQEYEFVSFNGDKKTARYLVSLGCISGSKIYLQSRKGGLLQIIIKGQRYVIDKNMGQDLFVKI